MHRCTMRIETQRWADTWKKLRRLRPPLCPPIVEMEETAAAITTAIWKLEPFIRSHLHTAPRIRENTLSFFWQINTGFLFWMGRIETRLHQCPPESRDSRQDKLSFIQRNNISEISFQNLAFNSSFQHSCITPDSLFQADVNMETTSLCQFV